MENGITHQTSVMGRSEGFSFCFLVQGLAGVSSRASDHDGLRFVVLDMIAFLCLPAARKTGRGGPEQQGRIVLEICTLHLLCRHQSHVGDQNSM